MALSFPPSPAIGDIFLNWQWTGSAWGPINGPTPTGDLHVAGTIQQGAGNPNASYQGIASISSAYNEVAVYGAGASGPYATLAADATHGYVYTTDLPLLIQADGATRYISFEIPSNTERLRLDANGAYFHAPLDLTWGGGNGLTLHSTSGAANSFVVFQTGSTSNWQLGAASASEPGNFWLYDVGHGALRLRVDYAGACYNGSGSWTSFSDAALKESIKPYTRGLDAIKQLQPVSFQYSAGTPFATADEPSPVYYGLIAGDVEPHIPEVCGETVIYQDGAPRMVSTITPGDLVYVLINAVKELDERLTAAEAKITSQGIKH